MHSFIGWGKGELQENFEKGALSYEGTQKLRKSVKHCITVPRTFVRDCRSITYFGSCLT